MRAFRTLALTSVLLMAVPSWAQKVVVLEIEGDASHRLRSQIESALRVAGTLEVLSLQSYKDAAVRRKLRGAAAFTSAGVARTSKSLKFDAAVGGETDGSTYKVLIWDRQGKELWTRDIGLKRGVLADEVAGKLTRAIAAAAAQGAARQEASDTTDDGDSGETGTDQVIEVVPPPRKKQKEKVPAEPPPPVDDQNRDSDLDAQPTPVSKIPAPPLIRGTLMGTTTWRSQCLRPGVSTCREYDLATTKPQGIVIDFTAPTPFMGVALGAELFPLRHLNTDPMHRFINGLGLMGQFNIGWSVILLREETSQGTGTPTRISSTDVGYAMQLLYRVHFAMGYGNPLPVGYVGLRAGFQSRNFNIDPTAATSLPSSQRTYPTGFGFPSIGLDLAVPVAPFLRVEAGASLFVNPRPSAEQIIGYGSLTDPTGGATSTGFGFEAGLGGDLFGPIGYTLKLRYMSFADHYYGQGQKWIVCNDSQCGGAAEEVYTQIVWGITAKY